MRWSSQAIGRATVTPGGALVPGAQRRPGGRARLRLVLAPIIDGHVDLLSASDRPFREGRLTTDGMLAAGYSTILAACWVGSPAIGLGHTYEPLAHHDAVRGVDRQLAAFEAAAAADPRLVRARGDAAPAPGSLAVVPHLEGAEPVAPDLSNLDAYLDRGVRSIGLVWSRPNAFGHGVPLGIRGRPDIGPGLTEAGRRLVQRCNAEGVLIDLAHLNEAGFWDVARLSDAPLVSSHTAVHERSPSARNLTTAQVRAVAASAGLVGLTFCTVDLRADLALDRDTPLDAAVEHLLWLIDAIGAEHVALGSDFDGALTPAALDGPADVPALLDRLRERGVSDAEISLIAHGNWQRVLRATWG